MRDHLPPDPFRTPERKPLVRHGEDEIGWNPLVPELDPVLLTGLTEHRVSRRRFLRYAGAGVGALGMSALLSACDVLGAPSPTPSAEFDWQVWWTRQTKAGVLDFANWPYYIDRHKARRPSLELFTEETGIEVNYYRPIKDTPSFFEKIRPPLEAGQGIGYDLMVLTNGAELSQLIDSGWLVPLDHSYLKNFDKHASALVKNPAWDPGNEYTVAWQSGLTGIAYSPKAAKAIGHEPRSVQDLWNPALKGRVGMMSDTSELGSFGLLAIGVDPETSTPEDWLRAADMLQLQRESLLPRYYDQEYLNALTRGDIWITLAWSGDIFQVNNLGYPELKFVVPDEGAMFWTDSMMIPVHAQHPVDAMIYMDFVYRPRVAAMIADWVGYITPVPASRPIIANELDDKELARSPLVFPGADILGDRVTYLTRNSQGELERASRFLGSHVRNYYVFEDRRQYQQWKSIFEPITYPQ